MTAVDLDALDKLHGPGPGSDTDCDADGQPWPCRVSLLIAEARKCRALREAVEGLAGRWQAEGDADLRPGISTRDQVRAATLLGSAARLRAVVATVDGEQ